MGKSKVDTQERQALYDQGLNDHEIARRLIVSPHAVFSWRKRNSLPPNATSRPKAASHISAKPRPKPRPKRKKASPADYTRRVGILRELWERTQAGETAAMQRRMEGA